MKKKIFFFIAMLGVMLSFSLPIFSMYKAILTRFEQDIKKHDIKKISSELLKTYDSYIDAARQQSGNKGLLGGLETKIMNELIRRQQEEPAKREEPKPQIPGQSDEEKKLIETLQGVGFFIYKDASNFDLEEALKNIEELVELAKNRKDIKQMNQYEEDFSDFYFNIRLELGKRKHEKENKDWKEILKGEIGQASFVLLDEQPLDYLMQLQEKIIAYANLDKTEPDNKFFEFNALYVNVNAVIADKTKKKPIVKEPIGKRINLVPENHAVVQRIRRIDDNISILQLRNSGQIEAKCGGLSLRNGMLVANFAQTNDPVHLQNLLSIQHMKKFLNDVGCANWVLVKNAIVQIAQAGNAGYYVESIGAVSSALVFDPNERVTDIALDQKQAGYVNKIKQQIIDGLKQAYFFYVLVMGNEEEVMGGHGHYFAFVIIKSGNKTQYVVIDSSALANHLDGYRYNRIKYLMDQFEKGYSDVHFPNMSKWKPFFG